MAPSRPISIQKEEGKNETFDDTIHGTELS
jgi:hypothetical protein